MSKPTCGPLYKDALERYAGDDPDCIRIFAAGFVSGQAEKIYLGACLAAMFRPSADRRDMILAIAQDVARRYDLYVVQEDSGEIWLCADSGAIRAVRSMATMAVNSPLWHQVRGMLLGRAQERD